MNESALGAALEALEALAKTRGVRLAAPEPGSQWGEILQCAAVAWLIDAETFRFIVENTKSPGLTLAKLIERPEIEAVPRMPETWRVRDDLRGRLAREWLIEHGGHVHEDSSLGWLALFWHTRSEKGEADPALALRFWAQVPDSPEFDRLLRRLFTEAEERFDLDRCRQLLEFATPLAEGIDRPWEEHVRLVREPLYRRLAARTRFADDWYKTAKYFRRTDLHDRLAAFLKPSEAEHWLLPICAAGGVGKTMLLRAWISRELIPSDVAVARIDFDFINWRWLAIAPWLVLLKLADQLRAQSAIAEGGWGRFHELRPEWEQWLRLEHAGPAPTGQPREASQDPTMTNATAGKFAYDFATALPDQRPVVVIFDTMEEPYLHGGSGDGNLPGPLPAILAMLSVVRQFRPNLRVVFSGRYDLFARRAADNQERIRGLAEAFGAVRQPTLEMRGFTREETIHYLRNDCNLKVPDEVCDAIFDKGAQASEADDESTVANAVVGAANPAPRALPFDVAFWAREAADKTDLNADTIRQAPGLHYAVERVLLRIPRPDVQWMIRYAVVPRRLTKAFLIGALYDALRRETLAALNDAERKDRGAATLAAENPQWKLKNLWERGAPIENLEMLWSETAAYAAGPEEGWLRVETEVGGVGVMKFHPRVVGPMRGLLEKEAVWVELQQKAQRFFLDRLQSHQEHRDLDAWAADATEAIFHAFQESPQRGEALYAELQSQAGALPWHVRLALAEMVIGDAGFEPGETRRPLTTAGGQRRVSEALELQALEESIYAALWQSCLSPTGWVLSIEHFDRFQSTRNRSERVVTEFRELRAYREARSPVEPKPFEEYERSVRQLFTRADIGEFRDRELLFELCKCWKGVIAADAPWAEHFDQFAKSLIEGDNRWLPKSGAWALAALIADEEGETQIALENFDRLKGADVWNEAAAWLGWDPLELKLIAARSYFTGYRTADADPLAVALSRDDGRGNHLPGILALELQIHSEIRQGKIVDPALLDALGQISDLPDDGDRVRLAKLTIERALASIHFQRLEWSSAGALSERIQIHQSHDGDLVRRTSVVQAFKNLRMGNYREARLAIEKLPTNWKPKQRRVNDCWPIAAETARLLHHFLTGNPGPRPGGLGFDILGPDVQRHRAEFLSSRVVVRDVSPEELLNYLRMLPNPAYRAASVWPLRFAEKSNVGTSDTETGATDATLAELFGAWIKDPSSATDDHLSELLCLADLLRVLRRRSAATRVIQQVVKRAVAVERPPLWREALLAADRLELSVHSAPPLPKDLSDPIWSVPLGPRIMLEAAQRYLRRHERRTAHELVARAQKAAGFLQLQQLPHVAWLRELEAELALDNGDQAKAIERWLEAARAWTELENAARADGCRMQADKLDRGDKVSVSAGAEKSASYIALFNESPPLLQLSATQPGGELVAYLGDEGSRLELEAVQVPLPRVLSQDDFGALSWLHHHLRVERAQFDAALGEILSRAADKLDGGRRTFLRLYSPQPLVMATPWEAIRIPGTEGPHSLLIVRRSVPAWPPHRLIQWVQQALNQLMPRGKHPLALDGKLGPQIERALKEFFGGEVPETCGTAIQTLANALREKFRPKPVEYPDDADRSAMDVALNAYRSSGIPLRRLNFEEEPIRTNEPAGLIHLRGTFVEASDSSEPVLMSGRARFTVSDLARRLGVTGYTEKPVIALECLLDSRTGPVEEFDRQILRRNLFAHRLYGSGAVLAVIATSTAPPWDTPAGQNRASEFASLVARGGTLADAIQLLQATEGPLSPYGGPTTALWAPHPELPILSQSTSTPNVA